MRDTLNNLFYYKKAFSNFLITFLLILPSSASEVDSQTKPQPTKCTKILDSSYSETKASQSTVLINLLFNLDLSSIGHEVQNLLAKEEFSGEDLIKLLSKNASLKRLFNADAGVHEGYSIKQHTLMVYEVFRKQLPYFIETLKNPEGIDIIRLLKFIIAVHDIGAPIAIAEESKKAQHDYTEPLLTEIMTQLNFSEEEVNIARALISNDVFGNLLKGLIKPDEAHNQIKALAAVANINPKDFFHLQRFLYTIDAASYPQLRSKVFNKNDGMLIPKKIEFENLQSLIYAHVYSSTGHLVNLDHAPFITELLAAIRDPELMKKRLEIGLRKSAPLFLVGSRKFKNKVSKQNKFYHGSSLKNIRSIIDRGIGFSSGQNIISGFFLALPASTKLYKIPLSFAKASVHWIIKAHEKSKTLENLSEEELTVAVAEFRLNDKSLVADFSRSLGTMENTVLKWFKNQLRRGNGPKLLFDVVDNGFIQKYFDEFGKPKNIDQMASQQVLAHLLGADIIFVSAKYESIVVQELVLLNGKSLASVKVSDTNNESYLALHNQMALAKSNREVTFQEGDFITTEDNFVGQITTIDQKHGIVRVTKKSGGVFAVYDIEKMKYWTLMAPSISEN